jgi:hypothetical protein
MKYISNAPNAKGSRVTILFKEPVLSNDVSLV